MIDIPWLDVDWLIDFKTQSTKYVVYLDSELYAKYKNPTVSYEKGEINEN